MSDGTAGDAEDGRMARIRAEDALLFQLARGNGRGRLELGEAAAMFAAVEGPGAFGFSTRDAYARERVVRSGRWVDDSARLARRLRRLPRIRDAFVEGRISWCMAELLARGATPENEEELLRLALTPGVTVHAMREYLQEDEEEEEDERDPSERRCSIEEVAPMEQALFVEATRMLIQHQNGGSDWNWFEYLFAEGMATAPELFQTEVLAEIAGELQEAAAQAAEAKAKRAEAEELAEPGLPDNGVERGGYPEPERLPNDLSRLDGVMVRTAMRLTCRDLVLGRIASDFFRGSHWKDLGYGTDTQYCQERLGMSRSAVWQRITLARRCERLPALAEALSSMDIGFESAVLVARVASPATEKAWIERASKRTFKHLREEVLAVLAERRLGERKGALWPPTEEEMREHEDFERDMLGGETIGAMLDELAEQEAAEAGSGPGGGEGQAAGPEIWIEGSEGHAGAAEGAGAAEDAGRDPIQISATSSEADNDDSELEERIEEALEIIEAHRRERSKGEVAIRIRTNEEVALYYRAARVRYRELGRSSTLLMALCTWFWETWIHEVRAEATRWDPVHRRDRFRCASPSCERRLCTLHHIIWRMLGGDDRWTNLLTLCEKCHLDNVHDKESLKIFGEAPHGLTFVFGKKPVITVRGREKQVA